MANTLDEGIVLFFYFIQIYLMRISVFFLSQASHKAKNSSVALKFMQTNLMKVKLKIKRRNFHFCC